MILKNLNKNFLVNLFLVLSIFLLDRLSKIYVIYLDKKFLGSEIFSSKYLNINLIWNDGIAFGLFPFEKNTRAPCSKNVLPEQMRLHHIFILE